MSKITDQQIKTYATKMEKLRVFENFQTPMDIMANCSDGIYIRKLWTNPNGNFGWDAWEKF